jgi:hypothetical protein
MQAHVDVAANVHAPCPPQCAVAQALRSATKVFIDGCNCFSAMPTPPSPSAQRLGLAPSLLANLG